jgi:hypothetical protein
MCSYFVWAKGTGETASAAAVHSPLISGAADDWLPALTADPASVSDAQVLRMFGLRLGRAETGDSYRPSKGFVQAFAPAMAALLSSLPAYFE